MTNIEVRLWSVFFLIIIVGGAALLIAGSAISCLLALPDGFIPLILFSLVFLVGTAGFTYFVVTGDNT